MTRHIPLRRGRLLLPVLLLLLLAACRGNAANDPGPTPNPIAAAAATPSPRPEVSPTATLSLPFPAPGEDTSRADSDPTIPTRTPTAEAATGALPAPVCNGLTPGTPEGVHYLPNTPQRTALRETGMAGDPLLITGYVLDANCASIPGAWLDFWQADADGVYDTGSFRLRGHQFTDADGRYRLETIIPGPAGGRPRHLFVKVQAPGGPVLTTQLFFPDDPANTADADFRPELLLTFTDEQTVAFDFVIAMP